MSEQSLDALMSSFFSAAQPTKTADGPAVGELRRVMTTPEIRSIDENNRTIDFVASTEAVDRYGDILRVKGFQLDA